MIKRAEGPCSKHHDAGAVELLQLKVQSGPSFELPLVSMLGLSSAVKLFWPATELRKSLTCLQPACR